MLVELESAKYLYRIAKKEEILRFYNKELSANINELIKRAKENEVNRDKLDVFYNLSVTIFENFIRSLRQDLGFTVDILDSTDDDYQLAKVHMRITQLDPTDSLHLAIARMNGYQYLATLDSDFVHNYYSNVDSWNLKIIKVA
ncbi:type II toxin-antitoxin system VapC family toxin [Ammoniphilus sp. 3BR4]